ncbi:MAG: peptidase, partial [Paenibacillus sp.]|nr:peptidase [Paenibacillus sp.]
VHNNPGGVAQRELDYLLRVTEIIDAAHIRVNYKLGWPIAKGRQVTFKQMSPDYRSHVRNMRFVGVSVPPTASVTVRPFETWDQIGSNPVAYEFVVECDVSGIYATRVFGGNYKVTDSCIPKGRYFLLTSCVEENVNRHALPDENNVSIKHSTNNIIVSGNV